MSDYLQIMILPRSPFVRWLGLAGLLPQVFFFLAVISGEQSRWIALGAAFGYAAVIFSFLGGLWWGIGLARPNLPSWIFGAAIAPSLIAFATYLPWIWGLNWPQPSLIVLGICLMASPLVDTAIGGLPDGWLMQRWIMSLGLGGLTLLLGFL